MDMKEVKSSNIEAVGYDPKTRVLAIRFKGSGLYHYNDVPPEIHEKLTSAESVGKYFGEHVLRAKDRHGEPKFKHERQP